MKGFIRLLAACLLSMAMCSCSVMLPRYARHKEYPSPKLDYKPCGILEGVVLKSSEPDMKERRAMVYLPENYYETQKSYPVMYLLHGARGNELTWIELGHVLHSVDSLQGLGIVGDFILVMPNMNSYRDSSDFSYSRAKNAMSTFFEVDGTVEGVFVNDVVMEIDRRYRTLPEKERRVIAGMSIGAFQTIYISASNPDVFGSVGLFSPMAHSVVRPGKNSSFYKKLWEKLDAQFRDPPSDYKIMIGKTDFFYPHMKRWSKELDKRGYVHDLYIVEGGHEWYNWEAFAAKMIAESSALDHSSACHDSKKN